MDSMTAIGGIVPWMLVEGNHERDQPFTGDRYDNQNADSGGTPPSKRRDAALAASILNLISLHGFPPKRQGATAHKLQVKADINLHP